SRARARLRDLGDQKARRAGAGPGARGRGEPGLTVMGNRTVAVIGLGHMGGAFARRLLRAGHEVVVWNRTHAKVEQMVAEGAQGATSPGDAAARADAVITMVANPSALREVTESGDGIAAGVRPGTTVIEMSTVGP